MTSCYWGSCSWASERHDPSLPYLEQYRIDSVQFAQLFSGLAPWVCGTHTSTLSARLFRLLDQNQDGLVNFKEFITGLSESGPFAPWCRGEGGFCLSSGPLSLFPVQVGCIMEI